VLTGKKMVYIIRYIKCIYLVAHGLLAYPSVMHVNDFLLFENSGIACKKNLYVFLKPFS
jgi:hypothetical protein